MFNPYIRGGRLVVVVPEGEVEEGLVPLLLLPRVLDDLPLQIQVHLAAAATHPVGGRHDPAHHGQDHPVSIFMIQL